MLKVKIEVSGGVAYPVSVPGGVEVTIWDKDNEECTPENEKYKPYVEIGPIVEPEIACPACEHSPPLCTCESVED